VNLKRERSKDRVRFHVGISPTHFECESQRIKRIKIIKNKNLKISRNNYFKNSDTVISEYKLKNSKKAKSNANIFEETRSSREKNLRKISNLNLTLLFQQAS